MRCIPAPLALTPTLSQRERGQNRAFEWHSECVLHTPTAGPDSVLGAGGGTPQLLQPSSSALAEPEPRLSAPAGEGAIPGGAADANTAADAAASLRRSTRTGHHSSSVHSAHSAANAHQAQAQACGPGACASTTGTSRADALMPQPVPP